MRRVCGVCVIVQLLVQLLVLLAGCDASFQVQPDAAADGALDLSGTADLWPPDAARDAAADGAPDLAADATPDLAPDANPNLPLGCPGPAGGLDVTGVQTMGMYSAVAVDPSSGSVHISHVNIISGRLYHSVFVGGAWTHHQLQIDSGGTGIEVSPAGKALLVFEDIIAFKLKLVSCDLAGCGAPQAVPDLIAAPFATALDQSGGLHVLGQGPGNATLLHLVRQGSSWSSAEPVGQNPANEGAALALSGVDGSVHAAWCDTAGRLMYRKLADSGASQPQELATGLGAGGCHPDLAVDAAGEAHLVFIDKGAALLKVLHQSGGAFTKGPSTVAPFTKPFYSNARVVADRGSGDLWLIYGRPSPASIAYERYHNGIWQSAETADTGASGNQISAVLGPGGVLHLCDPNKSLDGLRYARICP